MKKGSSLKILFTLALAVLFAGSVALASVEIKYPPARSAIAENYSAIYGKAQPSAKVDWQQFRLSGIVTGQADADATGRFNFSVELDPGVNRIVVSGVLLEIYREDGKNPTPTGFFKRNAHAGDISACEDCHDPISNALLDGGFPQVCLACHVVVSLNPQNSKAPTENSHFNTVIAKCTNCHEPHIASARKLIKPTSVKPCESCHSEKYAGEDKHQAFEEGGCAACHDSHYSGFDYNLHQDRPAVCHDCHNQGKGLRVKEFHPPSAQNSKWCSACHDPHGTTDTLLRQPAKPLCVSCHPKVLRNGHGKELEDCAMCHDPHKQLGSGLLKSDFPSGCEECHDSKRTGKTVHPPVAKGCDNCHNPHSATNKKDAVAKCQACHNYEDDNELRVVHGNLPLTYADCANCHPIHTSAQDKLVKKRTHFPLLQAKCDACHNVDGVPSRKIKDINAKCDACHTTLRDLKAKNAKIHDPVNDEGCTSCHDPHMSDNKAFLKKTESSLCAECHPVAKTKDPKITVHAAASTCTDCHGPHGGELPKFLTAKPPKLCLDCHDDPVEGKKVVHSAMDEGCTACHNPHMGYTKKLLKSQGQKLCLECHSDPAKDKGAVHPALDEGCTACHKPHSSSDKKLIEGDIDKLCLSCHDDPRKGKKFVHTGMDEGCTSCHTGHASPNKPLLKKPINDVCAECHDDMSKHHDLKASSANDYPGGGFPLAGDKLSCLGCHKPHASDEKNLYPEPEKKICNSCH